MLASLSLICYNSPRVWEIEFYRDKNGREPLTAFLNDLPFKTRARVVKLLDLLAAYGVLLKEPYTRQIKGKIRELRIKDNLGHIRVLYFTFTGRRIVLLHGFLKKTGKTPESEIALAEKRMKDFIERYGGKS
jgi:phage-related protein